MGEVSLFVARNKGFRIAKHEGYVLGSTPLDVKQVDTKVIWATESNDHETVEAVVFEMLFPKACWLEPGEGQYEMVIERNDGCTILRLKNQSDAEKGEDEK